MPTATPDAPGLGRERDDFSITFDGTHHIFWNRWAIAGPDDETVDLEIAGNVRSPIAMWWAQASRDLAECWRETPRA